MVYGDLHVHTKASDGLLELEEVVEEANRKGLKAIAITDHDVIHPNLEERVERRSDLEIITGVEVKTIHKGTRAEILCYFLDPENNGLETLLEEMRTKRIERMERMVERFNSLEKGAQLTIGDVKKHAEGSVGRPHFARAIVEKGFAEESQAFDEYAKRGTSYYVPLEKPETEEVIRRAKESGAFVSLAHPCNEEIKNPKKFIKDLKDLGLHGCEVHYPYNNSTKDLHLNPNKVKKIAGELGLIETGGSDFHDKESFTMGSAGISKETLKKMKRSVGL